MRSADLTFATEGAWSAVAFLAMVALLAPCALSQVWQSQLEALHACRLVQTGLSILLVLSLGCQQMVSSFGKLFSQLPKVLPQQFLILVCTPWSKPPSSLIFIAIQLDPSLTSSVTSSCCSWTRRELEAGSWAGQAKWSAWMRHTSRRRKGIVVDLVGH